MSNNQLEYIIIDEDMKGNCFVTSYNNFISDHKTIIARIGSTENMLTDEIKERMLFDQESHLKPREDPSLNSSNIESPHKPNRRQPGRKDKTESQSKCVFTRKFNNPDMSTCWLNSCLQLLLTAIDYDEDITRTTYNSELGKELLYLQSKSNTVPLDPSIVKNLLVAAEDLRIASRLSVLSYEILDKKKLDNQSQQVNRSRLDLSNGQQCVRDFFLCLNENMINWPDVFSTLAFQLTHSTECLSCKHKIHSETTQLYLDLPVPPSNSNLKDYVEDFLNEGSTIGLHCQEGCEEFTQKVKRTTLTTSDEAGYLTVILSRGIETLDGFQLVKHKIKATEDINIR